MSEAFVTPHIQYVETGHEAAPNRSHSRTGDKGNISNISVIAFEEKHYPPLLRNVTAERVKDHFREIAHG